LRIGIDVRAADPVQPGQQRYLWRLGAWLDPDHQLRETSDDLFLRALQPRGEDQVHWALGLGVAFQRFQIDVGVDFADQVDTASVSAVYSF